MKISDSSFQVETLFVGRFFVDHSFAELFPGQTVLALPRSFRTQVQPVQVDCTHRRLRSPKTEYYDKENNLMYIAAPEDVQSIDVKENTPFGSLLDAICGARSPT